MGLQKAFDEVPWGRLLARAETRGIEGKLLIGLGNW